MTGDADSVWDSSVPPGGYVCSVCGMPTESEPCREHQPAATRAMDEEAQCTCGGRPYEIGGAEHRDGCGEVQP